MALGHQSMAAAFVVGFVSIVTGIIGSGDVEAASAVLGNCSWSASTLDAVPGQGFWVAALCVFCGAVGALLGAAMLTLSLAASNAAEEQNRGFGFATWLHHNRGSLKCITILVIFAVTADSAVLYFAGNH